MRAGGVFFLAVLLFLLAGCFGAEFEQPAPDGTIIVGTTIHPLADLVRQVGGEKVTVFCLLPPGASPHTYEPTAEQARAATAAGLFILIGGGLDEWAAGLIPVEEPGVRRLNLIEESSLVEPGADPVREHNREAGLPDPHLWLDPLLVRDVISPLITGALAKLAPEDEAYFQTRLGRYQEELTALDAEINAKFSGLSSRRFVTLHAAWLHFAHRYALEEVAVITHFPGQEPSAAWMAELVDLIREQDVRAVFAEPQFSSALAEGIATEAGVPILTVDPLGGTGVPGRETYLDLLRYNAHQFYQALR